MTNSSSSNPELITELYREWKRYGHHLKEYGSEFLGTAFMVFCVIGVVGAMFAHSSPVPSLIPSTTLRLLITGLLLGGSGWVVAITPPGKLSGAHINPAISVGFWILGKMHFRDLLGYIAGQMTGGLMGAFVGRTVFGQLAVEVKSAALVPANWMALPSVFLAEAAASFILAFVVFTFVSHHRLLHWTPAAATFVVGILVMIDGNYSGCGINPARWFGPAAVTADWHDFVAYLCGPIVGAAAAAALRWAGWFGNPRPHTGKLFTDPSYRSIFRHDRIPSAPPV